MEIKTCKFPLGEPTGDNRLQQYLGPAQLADLSFHLKVHLTWRQSGLATQAPLSWPRKQRDKETGQKPIVGILIQVDRLCQEIGAKDIARPMDNGKHQDFLLGLTALINQVFLDLKGSRAQCIFHHKHGNTVRTMPHHSLRGAGTRPFV